MARKVRVMWEEIEGLVRFFPKGETAAAGHPPLFLCNPKIYDLDFLMLELAILEESPWALGFQMTLAPGGIFVLLAALWYLISPPNKTLPAGLFIYWSGVS
jgi:hypothetical protein